jgi:hypothetical protein
MLGVHFLGDKEPFVSMTIFSPIQGKAASKMQMNL